MSSGRKRDSGAESDSDLAFLKVIRDVAHAPSIDPSTIGQAARDQGEALVGASVSHFKVTRRIGAGGMGLVYEAEDERLRRKVALKVLPPRHASDTERQQRLLREARNAAAVNHPNIAAIYEVGEEQGTAFIAMEFLEGHTLRADIEGGRRSPGKVLSDALQIAQGLARAHQAGIVHRDLKPENVMVCADRLIKILDFGLAKLQAAHEDERRAGPAPRPEGRGDGSWSTRDGLVMGTPHYMSPEQAAGKPVDARTDIYAFGVMLLEMVTGRSVSRGEDTEELLQSAAALPLPELRSDLEQHAGLRRVSARCMSKSPARRYPDGAALLEDLRGLSVDDAGPAVPSRVGTLVGIALIAAVVLAGGFVFIRGDRLFARPRPAPEPRGATVRRLTANPPENQLEDAALSPDGKVLAYVDRTGLYLRRLEPSRTDAVALPEHLTPQSVAWFPRGEQLLVTGLEAGMPGISVWVLGPGGKGYKFAQAQVRGARISPDGKQLAWIGPEGVLRCALAGGKPTVVVGPERERQAQTFDQLSFSPDGKQLAFLRFSNGAEGSEASLEVVSLDGGRRVVLLRNPRLAQENGHGALVWAQDGRLVYALAEWPPHDTGSTLWSIALDPETGLPGDSPRPLHAWSGSFPALLSVSTSGALAYVLYETQADVYVAELAEGGRKISVPRRTTLSDHNERPSGWTRDGQALLYTSDQDGSEDVFSQDVRTGASVPLVVGGESQTWPAVAPDGAILHWRLPRVVDDQPHTADLIRLAEGAPPVVLLTTRHAAREVAGVPPPLNARFRCAAAECVLGEVDGEELVFSALDPVRGRGPVRLRIPNPGAGQGWDLAPRGGTVAVPVPGGKLRVVDLATGKSLERIVDVSCDVQSVTWSADAVGLFVTTLCPGERPYKVFFTEVRKPAHLLWESSYALAANPVASPDGKHLALAIKPFDNDAWLLSGW